MRSARVWHRLQLQYSGSRKNSRVLEARKPGVRWSSIHIAAKACHVKSVACCRISALGRLLLTGIPKALCAAQATEGECGSGFRCETGLDNNEPQYRRLGCGCMTHNYIYTHRTTQFICDSEATHCHKHRGPSIHSPHFCLVIMYFPAVSLHVIALEPPSARHGLDAVPQLLPERQGLQVKADDLIWLIGFGFKAGAHAVH